jgi:hypothetical protein
VNTHFLPDIDFKNIINDETLSEKTKQIIWKYLQLILFTVIGTIKEKDEFGDYERCSPTSIRKNSKKKINETISSMMGFFGSADDATATATDEPDATPPRQRKLYTEQTS